MKRSFPPRPGRRSIEGRSPGAYVPRLVLALLFAVVHGCADAGDDPTEPRSLWVEGFAVLGMPEVDGVALVAGHEDGYVLSVLTEGAGDEEAPIGIAVAGPTGERYFIATDPVAGLPRYLVLEDWVVGFRNWDGAQLDAFKIAPDGTLALERRIRSQVSLELPGGAGHLSALLSYAGRSLSAVACADARLHESLPELPGCGSPFLSSLRRLREGNERSLGRSGPGFEALKPTVGCEPQACAHVLAEAFARVATDLEERKVELEDSERRLRLVGEWVLTHVGEEPWSGDDVIDTVVVRFDLDGQGEDVLAPDEMMEIAHDRLGCYWADSLAIHAVEDQTLALSRDEDLRYVVDGDRLTLTRQDSTRRFRRAEGPATLDTPRCRSLPASLSLEHEGTLMGRGGAALSEPVEVVIRDRRDVPVPNVVVEYRIRPRYGNADDARFRATTVVTDQAGRARSTWTLSSVGEWNEAEVVVPSHPSLRQDLVACGTFPDRTLRLIIEEIDGDGRSFTLSAIDSRPSEEPFTWKWGDGASSSGASPQSYAYPEGVDRSVRVSRLTCSGDSLTGSVEVNERVANLLTWNRKRWLAGHHPLGRGFLDSTNVSTVPGGISLEVPEGSFDGAEFQSSERYHYGSYEARLRTTSSPGTLTAFFLYELVPGHVNDEIDIEILNDGSREVILATWVDGILTNEAMVTLPFDPTDGHHDYRIEWSRERVRFLADGYLLGEFVEGIPESPMHIMTNTWWPRWLSGLPLATARAVHVDRILY